MSDAVGLELGRFESWALIVLQPVSLCLLYAFAIAFCFPCMSSRVGFGTDGIEVWAWRRGSMKEGRRVSKAAPFSPSSLVYCLEMMGALY
jgi:hypothetical protein